MSPAKKARAIAIALTAWLIDLVPVAKTMGDSPRRIECAIEPAEAFGDVEAEILIQGDGADEVFGGGALGFAGLPILDGAGVLVAFCGCAGEDGVTLVVDDALLGRIVAGSSEAFVP